MLKTNTKAPIFKLPSTSKNNYSLKDSIGKYVVIYFYPKADTPGCTKESCEFQSNLKKFNKFETTVFGISKDSVQRQSKFAEKYKLKFNLLSDESEKICEKFGVWVNKSMYER